MYFPPFRAWKAVDPESPPLSHSVVVADLESPPPPRYILLYPRILETYPESWHRVANIVEAIDIIHKIR